MITAIGLSILQIPLLQVAAPLPHLHIETDNPQVDLFRIVGSSQGVAVTTYGTVIATSAVHFQRVCRAPCDIQITDPQLDYFFAGDSVTESDRFSLVAHREGNVRMRVEAGSSGLHALGKASTFVGILSILTGVTIYALQSDGAVKSGSGPLIFSLTGGALVVIGVPLVVENSTTFEFEPTTVP